MKKTLKYLLFIFLIMLISTKNAYCLVKTNYVDELDKKSFISNGSKLYLSSFYSNENNKTINNIRVQYVPYEEDKENYKKYIINNEEIFSNKYTDYYKKDYIYVDNYKKIFDSDYSFDGWLVEQSYYDNENLNIILIPYTKNYIKDVKYTYYTFNEIDINKYSFKSNIKQENIFKENESIQVRLSDYNECTLTYRFNTKKDNEILYFKLRGNIKDNILSSNTFEIYLDNNKLVTNNINNNYNSIFYNIKNKGEHRIEITYKKNETNDDNKDYYYYIKDIGLLNKLEYNKEEFDKSVLKKSSYVLKEEEYKTNKLYEIKYYKKKNHIIHIILGAILLILIVLLILKIKNKRK